MSRNASGAPLTTPTPGPHHLPHTKSALFKLAIDLLLLGTDWHPDPSTPPPLSTFTPTSHRATPTPSSPSSPRPPTSPRRPSAPATLLEIPSPPSVTAPPSPITTPTPHRLHSLALTPLQDPSAPPTPHRCASNPPAVPSLTPLQTPRDETADERALSRGISALVKRFWGEEREDREERPEKGEREKGGGAAERLRESRKAWSGKRVSDATEKTEKGERGEKEKGKRKGWRRSMSNLFAIMTGKGPAMSGEESPLGTSEVTVEEDRVNGEAIQQTHQQELHRRKTMSVATEHQHQQQQQQQPLSAKKERRSESVRLDTLNEQKLAPTTKRVLSTGTTPRPGIMTPGTTPASGPSTPAPATPRPFQNVLSCATMSGLLVAKRESEDPRVPAKAFLCPPMFYLFYDSAPARNLCASVAGSTVKLYGGERARKFGFKLPNECALMFQAPTEEDAQRWFDCLCDATSAPSKLDYALGKTIGTGSYSKVCYGLHSSTNTPAAIKVISKNKGEQETVYSLKRELLFFSKQFTHPNLVETYSIFDSRDRLFIVTEWMSYGTIYDAFPYKDRRFPENDLRRIMKALFQALRALHLSGVVHRDIKPENILCCAGKGSDTLIKLADFGLCDILTTDESGTETASGKYGTPFYVAPEIVRGERYGTAVDMWSCGVVMYLLLTGKQPFEANATKEVLKKVKSGEVSFDGTERLISPTAKSLILALLELDPLRRLTADQALSHPFLSARMVSKRVEVAETVTLEANGLGSTGACYRECVGPSVEIALPVLSL